MDERAFRAHSCYEAGHAIAAHRLQATFEWISVSNKGPDGWQIFYDGGRNQLAPDSYAIVALAGVVAADLFDYHTPLVESDRAALEEVTRTMGVAEATAYEGSVMAQAHELLGTSKNMGAIKALATRLHAEVPRGDIAKSYGYVLYDDAIRTIEGS
jgi:hypothetical protein